jgi:prolyl-tRNA synthetase
VGNIFQLGEYYSQRMNNATFIGKDGKLKPFYMGCYGIGLGRTMATIAEIYNDEKGLVWPKAVAPFEVYLIGLNGAMDKAEEIYRKLKEKEIEVLFDDREDVSAGVKFADADLIGIPVRLIVSPKTGDKIEYKERDKTDSKLLGLEEIAERIK